MTTLYFHKDDLNGRLEVSVSGAPPFGVWVEGRTGNILTAKEAVALAKGLLEAVQVAAERRQAKTGRKVAAYDGLLAALKAIAHSQETDLGEYASFVQRTAEAAIAQAKGE